MEPIIKTFPTSSDLAKAFARDMVKKINESAKAGKPFTIALSGGTTPELLFRLLAKEFADSVPWQYVHLFWGDERCVAPDNKESNYGMTSQTLLCYIDIPAENVHRILGEADPDQEASRYSEEISLFTSSRNGIPKFDLVILGLGEDGHTASIFPGHLNLFESEDTCAVASHPVSGQKRITITGRVINNAETIAFLVTGEKKAAIVEKLLKNEPGSLNYPAAYAVPVFGQIFWYLNEAAAAYMSR